MDIAKHFDFQWPPRTRINFEGSGGEERYSCGTKTRYTEGGIFAKDNNKSTDDALADPAQDQHTDQPKKGWSNDGIKRYNELVEKVKQDREAHPRFFQDYKHCACTDAAERAKRKRKLASQVAPTVVVNELFCDSNDENGGTNEDHDNSTTARPTSTAEV